MNDILYYVFKRGYAYINGFHDVYFIPFKSPILFHTKYSN